MDLQQRREPYFLEIPENIELNEIRIYEKMGNFFLKTTNSLLFFYRNSNKLEWLINGKILAIGKDFALYETE